MPLPLARTLLIAAVLILSAASCASTELPAFANPPPYDAGADADQDAGPER